MSILALHSNYVEKSNVYSINVNAASIPYFIMVQHTISLNNIHVIHDTYIKQIQEVSKQALVEMN